MLGLFWQFDFVHWVFLVWIILCLDLRFSSLKFAMKIWIITDKYLSAIQLLGFFLAEEETLFLKLLSHSSFTTALWQHKFALLSDLYCSCSFIAIVTEFLLVALMMCVLIVTRQSVERFYFYKHFMNANQIFLIQLYSLTFIFPWSALLASSICTFREKSPSSYLLSKKGKKKSERKV